MTNLLLFTLMEINLGKKMRSGVFKPVVETSSRFHCRLNIFSMNEELSFNKIIWNCLFFVVWSLEKEKRLNLKVLIYKFF